jgi:hypothetical protein
MEARMVLAGRILTKVALLRLRLAPEVVSWHTDFGRGIIGHAQLQALIDKRREALRDRKCASSLSYRVATRWNRLSRPKSRSTRCPWA